MVASLYNLIPPTSYPPHHQVADFGAAKIKADTADASTMTQIGTKAYCAPEVLIGRYTQSVDTFSFGLTLLEIAVGDASWVHTTRRDAYCGEISYTQGWRPPIPDALREATPKLATLIEMCWTAEPDKRA